MRQAPLQNLSIYLEVFCELYGSEVLSSWISELDSCPVGKSNWTASAPTSALHNISQTQPIFVFEHSNVSFTLCRTRLQDVGTFLDTYVIRHERLKNLDQNFVQLSRGFLALIKDILRNNFFISSSPTSFASANLT